MSRGWELFCCWVYPRCCTPLGTSSRSLLSWGSEDNRKAGWWTCFSILQSGLRSPAHPTATLQTCLCHHGPIGEATECRLLLLTCRCHIIITYVVMTWLIEIQMSSCCNAATGTSTINQFSSHSRESSVPSRFPQVIFNAQCLTSGCLNGGKEDIGLVAKPIYYQVLVLHRWVPAVLLIYL